MKLSNFLLGMLSGCMLGFYVALSDYPDVSSWWKIMLLVGGVNFTCWAYEK